MEILALIAVLFVLSIMLASIFRLNIFRSLAENDDGTVVTLIEENNIYTREVGGSFDSAFGPIPNWHYNDPSKEKYDERYEDFVLLPNNWGAPENQNPHTGLFEINEQEFHITKQEAEDRLTWFEKRGLGWIGFPWKYRQGSFNFRWSTWKKQETSQGSGIFEFDEVYRDMKVHSERFTAAYYIKVPGILTGELKKTTTNTNTPDPANVENTNTGAEGLPLDFEFIITVQTYDPQGRYRFKDWLDQINAKIAGGIDDWAGGVSYEYVIEHKHNNDTPSDTDSLKYAILNMNTADDIKKLGKRILNVTIMQARPSSEIFDQIMEGSAKVTLAELRKKEMKFIGEGDAAKLAAELKTQQAYFLALGRNKGARELATMEMISKMPNLRVLGSGIPGVTSIVNLDNDDKDNKGGIGTNNQNGGKPYHKRKRGNRNKNN